jgi:hypothetical protein
MKAILLLLCISTISAEGGFVGVPLSMNEVKARFKHLMKFQNGNVRGMHQPKVIPVQNNKYFYKDSAYFYGKKPYTDIRHSPRFKAWLRNKNRMPSIQQPLAITRPTNNQNVIYLYRTNQ